MQATGLEIKSEKPRAQLFHQPLSIAPLQLHLQNVQIFELPIEIRHLQCFIFGVEKSKRRPADRGPNVPAWLDLSDGRDN